MVSQGPPPQLVALDGSAALSATGMTAAEMQRRLSRSYECQQRRQHSSTAAAAAAPLTAIQHGGRTYHLVPLDDGSLELHDESCVVRGVLQVCTTTRAHVCQLMAAGSYDYIYLIPQKAVYTD
eukprot:COSAG01_NODE_2805_length_7043_cov_17.934620_3_plen_123_part_00